MANEISEVFVHQYEAEVHVAYQDKGSRLRPTVRLKTDVVGESTTFPIIGKGEANEKARHAEVTPMDVDHSKATAYITDNYAPEYVDKFDEYKIKHDERKALIDTGAYAIGRKVDFKIIQAALAALLPEHTVGDGSAKLSLDSCLEAFGLLNEANAPDDGQRYAVVGPWQWNQLLKIDQFSKSNYVGDEYAWLKGCEAKRWLNTVWMMHTGLPKVGDTPAQRSTQCIMYHKNALGLAENGNGIHAEINYVATRVAHLCNNMIGCGAVGIDPEGIVCLWAKDK